MRWGPYTREVQEIRILVELVEDSTRAILDIRGGENSNRVPRKSFGEPRAAVVVLLRRDSGRNCLLRSAAAPIHSPSKVSRCTFTGLQQVGMRLMQRLAKFEHRRRHSTQLPSGTQLCNAPPSSSRGRP